jgi:uncharacterized membrane protein YbaN (DUF454 family)
LKFIWTAAGTVFLGIGIAGVILPVMPGTVFLFLASLCYVRGSKRLHDWLMNHPVLGRQVKVMTGELPMPRRSKIVAISAMWIAVAISAFTVREHLIVHVVLASAAVFGTWFIVQRR